MTAEQATLVASTIAAIASVIALAMNLLAAKSAEMRVAYRQSLEEYIYDLSAAIHSTIATARILTQAKTDPAIRSWRGRANEAQSKLKDLRIILRYPLWGITDGMNTLMRFPDWIENARPFPDHADDIFEKGKALGHQLDVAIRNSYTHGRPPTWLEQLRVQRADRQLLDAFERLKKDNSLLRQDPGAR